MPHQSSNQVPPQQHGYSAHSMRGRSPHPRPPHPVHMIHHSEAARMAAYQHQHAQAYGGHPAYHGHHMPPPPMWHPADAAAQLNRTEMGHPDMVVSHNRHTELVGEDSPSAKRIRRTGTMESAEEAAASALLMASGMRASPKLESSGTEQPPESAAEAVSREPLKKRKHFEVETKLDPATGTPCHVSPGSASSQTDESVTIVTQSSRTLFEASSGSYDTRETKRELAHFPSVLHKVLDMPDARSVLQWLPSGEAWKIVRWDALRREVLPRYFPELCKGEDGSMDAFLRQVRAWGFEEITDGDDAGAYRHLSFVRGTLKLCKHMTYKEEAPKLPETKSPGSDTSHSKEAKSEDASILQVPSLTSRSDGEQEPKETSQDRQGAAKKSASPITPHGHGRGSPVVFHPGWQHGGMAMSYRTRDGGYADPRLVHQTSPLRHGVTFPPPYSPRFPFRTPGGPPSPLVKSGRGGKRVSSRNSFPVSQRGKGGRARIVRSPITTPGSDKSVAKNESPITTPGSDKSVAKNESPITRPDSDKSVAKNESPITRPSADKSVAKTELEESRSTGLGPPPQKDSLVTGVSRKMTRKLPLARKSSTSSAEDPSKKAENANSQKSLATEESEQKRELVATEAAEAEEVANET